MAYAIVWVKGCCPVTKALFANQPDSLCWVSAHSRLRMAAVFSVGSPAVSAVARSAHVARVL